MGLPILFSDTHQDEQAQNVDTQALTLSILKESH